MLSPEPSSHSVLGVTPMPTTTTSAGMTVPSVRRTPSTRSVPSSAVDADAEAEVDAVVAVQLGQHHAHLAAERPLERHVEPPRAA